MSLTYYFSFGAPADAQRAELQTFLKLVEKEAQEMGFQPTVVLNVDFDTPERLRFARRLTKGLRLEDERLQSVSIPKGSAVWEHNPHGGSCRLLPEKGVVLVVTDEGGCEIMFGFFKFEEEVKDINGRCLAESKLGGRWHFKDFVDSPDPRFRKIVKLFSDAGYLVNENDEFV